MVDSITLQFVLGLDKSSRFSDSFRDIKTKPKGMSRRPGSDLEEGESQSTCLTPGERLRQSLRKQTKNEVGRGELDGKEMQKKITARSTPWKKSS